MSDEAKGAGAGGPAKRPPSQKPKSGGPKPASAKGRPVTAKGRTGPPKGKPGSQKARPGGGRPSSSRGPSNRFSPALIAYGIVGLVVLLVAVIVIVKVAGGGSSTPSTTGISAPTVTPAPASDLAAISSVTPAIENAVGLPSSVYKPTAKKGQSALTINGLPGAVFVGAEFCPYCGAERWALIMTFDRFGTFSGLQETTSSPWDTDPSTPTFTFAKATYTSKYVAFDPVEAVGNDTTAIDTRQNLDTPSKLQQSLWVKYDPPGNSFPFVDIGNKMLVTNPSYDPAVLQGLIQSQVAGDLSNSSSPVTQAIVGTANYLTAGVCSITNQMPSNVCSVSAVQKAASSLGIS